MNILGGAAVAALILFASALDANEASFMVDRFEWTAEEGCVGVSGMGTVREVIPNVSQADCAAVTSLTNVQIDYTHAEDGTGYLARIVAPQFTPFTCWYSDGVATVCQNQ